MAGKKTVRVTYVIYALFFGDGNASALAVFRELGRVLGHAESPMPAALEGVLSEGWFYVAVRAGADVEQLLAWCRATGRHADLECEVDVRESTAPTGAVKWRVHAVMPWDAEFRGDALATLRRPLDTGGAEEGGAGDVA